MASALPVKMHKNPYPAINPSRPELSQSGRTVLITGSATGIGFHIAKSFAQAEAKSIILTGRREDKLREAAAELTREFPKTTFLTEVVDISDTAAAEQLWAKLELHDDIVDVLVLSAAKIQFEKGSLLEYGHAKLAEDFKTNVLAQMMHTEYFYHQKKRIPGSKLFLVSVSTMSIHDFGVNNETPSYAASKNAGTLVLQLVAKDVPATDMQIVSFHPGYIATDSAHEMGYTDPNLPWDDAKLPGHYAVWAASDDAAFLHGRFTWTAWDIDDLRTGQIGQRIANDEKYLRIGVHGI